MKIKTKSWLEGKHVHTSIWMGEGLTTAFVGSIITEIGEAQLFLAALSLGAEVTQEHLEVEHEGYLSAEWAKEMDAHEPR